MRLADYLEKSGKTGSDLALECGVDDATINRLIPKVGKKQFRKPSFDLIEKIARATDNQVTADDFMNQDLPSAAPKYEPAATPGGAA